MTLPLQFRATLRTVRHASIGLLLGVPVALASMFLMGCYGPEPEPSPPCEVIPGLAEETRVLEFGAYSNVYSWETDEYEGVWTPMMANDEVQRVRGGQGADMLSIDIRFPALPDEGTAERCMLIHYQRRGLGDAEYTVRNGFRRNGDYWYSSIADPLDSDGRVELVATVEDNEVMGSLEMSIVAAPPS